MKQKTIKNKISFSGIGLHSGILVNINLIPSSSDGIIFRRIDKNNSEIRALYNNVVDTNLGTTVSNGIEKILTIEHLMCAIWACDIDNLIIEIDNQEIPILDGSANIFIEEIRKAGIQELNIEKKYLKLLKETEFIKDGTKLKLVPDNKFSVDMEIEFNYGNIGKQIINFNGNKEYFIEKISMARTFCNQKEIEYMRNIGLAKGGSLDNAMVFDNKGIINKNGFRLDNEVVSHKLLDCLGDLYTSGYNLICKVISLRGGHSSNNEILKKLFENKSNYEILE